MFLFKFACSCVCQCMACGWCVLTVLHKFAFQKGLFVHDVECIYEYICTVNKRAQMFFCLCKYAHIMCDCDKLVISVLTVW